VTACAEIVCCCSFSVNSAPQNPDPNAPIAAPANDNNVNNEQAEQPAGEVAVAAIPPMKPVEVAKEEPVPVVPAAEQPTPVEAFVEAKEVPAAQPVELTPVEPVVVEVTVGEAKPIEETVVEEVKPVGEKKPVRVNIIFYSLYGHVYSMAKQIAKGVEAAGGVAKLLQVPETLSEEILQKMHAPAKPDLPVATTDDLVDCDAVLFGIPTRYGAACAQMKAFMDATGGLWAKGALVGKPAGIFFSTATQGGGQETTAFAFLTHFAHHGMLYVPIGYSSPLLFNNDEIHGGSPYGAGMVAGGQGERQASQLELNVAEHQGKYTVQLTQALLAGRSATA